VSTGRSVPNHDEQNSAAASVASDDRLTIRRLLTLTAGVALGLVVFVPSGDDINDVMSVDWWRLVWFAVLAGVALVSPLFVVGRRMRGQSAGAGGMLLLTLGFGVLLMVPPALADRSNGNEGFAVTCMAYCVPFVCLWYLIAAAAGGQLTRASLGRSAPWVERLGLYLALAGTPLGIWLLIEVYLEAF
jgi:hypothetical protein